MTEFVYESGFLSGAGLKFRAAIGRAGITRRKEEGDGATPAGTHKLLRVLYRADRVKPPICAVPLEPIGPGDAWCDDPADAAYNRPVRLPYPGRHEALHRADAIYDIIGILDWNMVPIMPHRGSAIFLHVATPDYGPTAGCLALSAADLTACLGAGISEIDVK